MLIYLDRSHLFLPLVPQLPAPCPSVTALCIALTAVRVAVTAPQCFSSRSLCCSYSLPVLQLPPPCVAVTAPRFCPLLFPSSFATSLLFTRAASTQQYATYLSIVYRSCVHPTICHLPLYCLQVLRPPNWTIRHSPLYCLQVLRPPNNTALTSLLFTGTASTQQYGAHLSIVYRYCVHPTIRHSPLYCLQVLRPPNNMALTSLLFTGSASTQQYGTHLSILNRYCVRGLHPSSDSTPDTPPPLNTNMNAKTHWLEGIMGCLRPVWGIIGKNSAAIAANKPEATGERGHNDQLWSL